jgi:hypothetical protein
VPADAGAITAAADEIRRRRPRYGVAFTRSPQIDWR